MPLRKLELSTRYAVLAGTLNADEIASPGGDPVGSHVRTITLALSCGVDQSAIDTAVSRQRYALRNVPYAVTEGAKRREETGGLFG